MKTISPVVHFPAFISVLIALTYSANDNLYYEKPQAPQHAYLSRFRVTWNAPTENCKRKFGIDFKLTTYGIEENRQDGWTGEFITIFYKNDIGLYPYFDDQGNPVNGGIPQTVNLTAHLKKAAADIDKRIPDPNFNGLGVIDWEPWRPLYTRNWDSKKIYKEASEALVRREHPTWSEAQVAVEAQRQFNMAARNMMEGTVRLAEEIRPYGKWGYYEFPECYNGRTGSRECDSTARSKNDELAWLFEACTTEYPSAYLSNEWNHTHKAGFVHGQVEEGLRVAQMGPGAPRPVVVYTRYQFLPFFPLYSKDDLIVSIKQPSDLGAAGVVLWGDHYSEFNMSVCQTMADYIHTTLGPTVASILNSTRTCEETHCAGRGRCVLKQKWSAPQWLQLEKAATEVWETPAMSRTSRLHDFYSYFYKCVQEPFPRPDLTAKRVKINIL